jgi:hypothetical protein
MALSMATIVLCLLVAEATTRLFDPSASLWRYPNYIHEGTPHSVKDPQLVYDPRLGWEPIPGLSGTLMGKPFSTSPEGLRQHYRAQPQPSGPSILAFGDSFTEGFAVGDDETWPAHLQRIVGRPVLNAGVRGYGLDQIELRAERLIPRLKPTTVVLAFIADDITRTGLSVRDSKAKPYFLPAGSGLALHNVPVPTAAAPRWLTDARDVLGYSHLLDTVMKRLDATALWYGNVIRTGADENVVACRLMARFAALARDQDAKALVVGLPQYVAWRDSAGLLAEHKALAAALDCAAKAGLPTLDGFVPFEREGVGRDPDSYYAEYHLTDRGNALAARMIAAILAAYNE